MARSTSGPEIDRMIQLMGRLPGLGHRSARKAALALVKRRNDLLLPLAEALREAADKLSTCSVCGNIDTTDPCTICQDDKRDEALIVVVEDVGDLWALERAGVLSARYHVLGGHISPLDGIGPDDLNISGLIARASDDKVREVLLALNMTVEGQSTAHYLSDALAEADVSISHIAQGVPVGGELDYLDEGTLAAAIKSRRSV
ncbi:MAG: recombination mediator RecR [Pseudomonadota bacterium]